MRIILTILTTAAALCGCAQIPSGTRAVTPFDIERFSGKWFEIARLDHPFERGLTDVSADYTQAPDGTIRVVNRGYSEKEGRWKQIAGRAKLAAGPNIGRLKVSFFGPFYGGYNVLALDTDKYSYALVAGNNRSYLWILSREPELPESIYQALVSEAKRLGFKTEDLIRVSHTRAGEEPK